MKPTTTSAFVSPVRPHPRPESAGPRTRRACPRVSMIRPPAPRTERGRRRVGQGAPAPGAGRPCRTSRAHLFAGPARAKRSWWLGFALALGLALVTVPAEGARPGDPQSATAAAAPGRGALDPDLPDAAHCVSRPGEGPEMVLIESGPSLPAMEVRSTRRVVPGRRRRGRAAGVAKGPKDPQPAQVVCKRIRYAVEPFVEGSWRRREVPKPWPGAGRTGAQWLSPSARRKGDWDVPFRILSTATLPRYAVEPFVEGSWRRREVPKPWPGAG